MNKFNVCKLTFPTFLIYLFLMKRKKKNELFPALSTYKVENLT